jgi:hypothetical protein
MTPEPTPTWFDGAAFDIFIAEGGVDDFEDLTDDELRKIIADVLPNYIPYILESAKALKNWGRM